MTHAATPPGRSPAPPRLRVIGRVVRQALAGFVDDRVASMGAAVAFYALFSLAPLLLIVVSLAGLVFDAELARSHVVEQIGGLAGSGAAQAVEAMMRSGARGQGLPASAIGAALALLGATTVFAELQHALDRIWRTPAWRPVAGVWGFVRARVLSVGLILGIVFLLVVSLLTRAALAALRAGWASAAGEEPALLRLMAPVAEFWLLAGLFAAIFRWLPRARLGWRDIGVGALATAALFTVGRAAIGLYLEQGPFAGTFGTAASWVAVVVWVYYSTQVVLFGAELTWAWSRSGSTDPGAGLAPPVPP